MATSFTDQDDFYKMDASPKGICLIINNFEFERSDRLYTGPADKENLTRTFKKMDFEVRYFENQTGAQMKTRMENIQKEDHSNYDCFVCCISSHGNKTGVCGADDQTVNISELQKYVFSTQCPSLAGKPKVFFVHACRGGEGQKGHYLARSGALFRGVEITDKRDFLVSFATTPDNKLYCNPDSTKGAVYFYHLTRLLEHYAKSKTLMHILHKLNEALTEESQGNKLQTAEYFSTLAKELRFYCPVQAMVPARKPPVIKPPGPTHPQAFRFHDNHGQNVVLSNNQQTAQYPGQRFTGGIVMSRDPMEVNKLYEVQITEKGGGLWTLYVGVVTSSPDSLTLPGDARGWPSAVVVGSQRVSDHGHRTATTIGQALDSLPLHSRVGVRVNSSGSLHLHVNGADQVVVPCRSLPDLCWALWELDCGYREVKTLHVT